MAYYSDDFANAYDDIEDLYEDDGWEDEDEVAEHREWENYYHNLAEEIEDD